MSDMRRLHLHTNMRRLRRALRSLTGILFHDTYMYVHLNSRICVVNA